MDELTVLATTIAPGHWLDAPAVDGAWSRAR